MSRKHLGKLTKEIFNVLLRIYNKYGNVCISVKGYNQFKDEFGDHTKKLLKKYEAQEVSCYIVEKI